MTIEAFIQADGSIRLTITTNQGNIGTVLSTQQLTDLADDLGNVAKGNLLSVEYKTHSDEEVVSTDEPDHDDAVHCCPDCERPNQFGEVCPSCQHDRQVEIAEREHGLFGDY